MIITKAKLNKFQEIHQIFQEVHDLHLNNTNNVFKDEDPFTKEEFIEILNNKNNFFLIAKEDKILGFIHAVIIEREGRKTKFKKIMSIEAIGVTKKENNKGIGTKLIEEIKSIAKKNKCDNIILDVWSFNNNAIDFYTNKGFKPTKIKMQIDL